MNKVEHYERLLSTKEKNAFILPKGYLVIRDITDTGHLVKYVSDAEFKKKGRKRLWVLLKLKVFRNKRGEFYPLFMCNSCEKMGSTDLLALNNALLLLIQNKKQRDNFFIRHNRNQK